MMLKVGDKVKVIKIRNGDSHYEVHIGRIFTIKTVSTIDMIYTMKEEHLAFFEDEVERYYQVKNQPDIKD